MSLFDDLNAWLKATAEVSEGDGDGFDLGSLNLDEISMLATDLEGIADSANQLQRRLAGLVESTPSADDLETHLVEIETDLNHALWHWKSLQELLETKAMWGDDDSKASK